MHTDEEEFDENDIDDAAVAWLDADETDDMEPSDDSDYLPTSTLDLNRAYIDEIARTKLLTPEEEVTLSKRMLRARAAARKLAQADLSTEGNAKLRTVLEDGLAARERLLMANTRLVISVAKRYANRGIPFLDLVHEGMVGLMRAAGKFDPDRGNRFSTYATWWIRQAITRAIDNYSRTIRLPVHITSQLNQIARATAGLEQDLGRPPTTDEIAEVLETDPELVSAARELFMQPISLEAPQDEEENRLLGDLIPDTDAESPEDMASSRILSENLDEALSELPWREARVLRLRFGLNGNTPHTLHQVGKVMGITRERVRQIEASALRRLRTFRIRSKLSDQPQLY